MELLPVVLAALAASLLALVVLFGLRTRHVRPNEVVVVSGRTVRNRSTGAPEPYRFVTSGRVFVWPLIEQAHALSLEIMSVPITAEHVSTRYGSPVTLVGVVQIKVAPDEAALRLAAERFLSKSPAEIVALARATLAGHVSMIASTLSTDDLRADPAALARRVRNVYAADLARMGLVIDALVIQRVSPVGLPT